VPLLQLIMIFAGLTSTHLHIFKAWHYIIRYPQLKYSALALSVLAVANTWGDSGVFPGAVACVSGAESVLWAVTKAAYGTVSMIQVRRTELPTTRNIRNTL